MPTDMGSSGDRVGKWLTAPALLALIGLIGTGVGAVLQGFWNTKLERQKFEFSLIQKALEAPDKKIAAENLKFLVDAGLIGEFSAERLSALANTPDRLPTFFSALVRTDLISVRDAKRVLKHVGIYSGAIDDVTDASLRKSISEFQKSQGLPADGLIGPMTATKLREAWPEIFPSD